MCLCIAADNGKDEGNSDQVVAWTSQCVFFYSRLHRQKHFGLVHLCGGAISADDDLSLTLRLDPRGQMDCLTTYQISLGLVQSGSVNFRMHEIKYIDLDFKDL